MENNKNKITLDAKNIKLIVTDAKYYYNKNNVTCKACYSLKTPSVLWSLIGNICGCVKATAYCDADDTYNKEIGNKIALAKAESKAYEKAKAELTKRITLIENIIYASEPLIEDFSNKTGAFIEHNKNYIDNISSNKSVENKTVETHTEATKNNVTNETTNSFARKVFKKLFNITDKKA